MTQSGAPPPSAPALQEHRFPCEACGGDLRYAPGEGRLICDHCGNTQSLEDQGGALPLKELDFRAALGARLPDAEIEETRVLSCSNCGAQVEFDAATHAAECPFCATPVVTDTGIHRHIKPRGVIPFVLTEAEARTAMTDWLGRLWFAPNGLQRYARKSRSMDGIYAPFWTFDADTDTRYRGERGRDYYETRTVREGGETRQVRVRKTRWTRVSGRVARAFDDVLVLASTSLPKRFTDALQPWDLSRLQPYRPEFLAGFRAEAYTVDMAPAFEEAREYMDRVIDRDIRFDIGGDRQRIHAADTAISDITFKHVLLPVWLAAYRYRGRSYRFVVNGLNGRVSGERPWSVWKVALAVALIAIAAAIVGYVAAQQQ